MCDVYREACCSQKIVNKYTKDGFDKSSLSRKDNL